MRLPGWMALWLLGACGTQEGSEKDGGGGDDTAEPPCEEADELALGIGEVSPLGFAGADVLAWLDDGVSAPLAWADGSTATLTFGFAAGDGVTYVHVLQNPGAAEQCLEPDHLRVDVAYTITTDDGRLDEHGRQPVTAATAGAATLVVTTHGAGGPLDGCGGDGGGAQVLEGLFTPGATEGRLGCERQTMEEVATW